MYAVAGSVAVWGLVSLLNRRVGKPSTLLRSDHGRELGLLERWYSAHEGRGDRNIVYVMKMQGSPPSLDQLTQCMVDLCLKHKGLNCETVATGDITKEAKEIIWQEIPTDSPHSSHPWAPVIIAVEREDENAAKKVVQTLVNQNFQANLPPWRIHLVSNDTDNQFEIILSVNHLVADGISGMIICKELLHKLCEKSSPAQNYHYPIPEDPFFALEESLDTRPRLISILSSLFRVYVTERISFLQRWKRGAFVPLGSDVRCLYTGEYECDSLSKELTSKLLQKCKAEGVSVHSAICVAAHVALAHLEDEINNTTVSTHSIQHCNNVNKQHQSKWTHKISTPTNLRRFAGINPQDNRLGVFISRINYTRTINGTSNIWSLAREIKEDVQHGVPSGIPVLGMIRFIPNLVKYLEMEFQKYPAGRDSTICLSNLGNQPILLPEEFEDGTKVPWKLLGINFTQQHHVGSGSSFMASIVTCAGKLHISICSAQPVIPVEWNQIVLSSIMNTLEAMTSSNPRTEISQIKTSLPVVSQAPVSRD